MVVVFAADPVISAPSPTTLPTTQPLELSGPMKMMLAYDRIAGSDAAAYRPFYLTHNQDEDVLVEAIVHNESMLGVLQVMLQKQWGDDGMNTVLHAFNERTTQDIVASKVEESGDTAKFKWPDGWETDLVKQNGVWKFDVTGIKNSLGMSVEDYIKYLQSLSPIIEKIAVGIDRGKLTTPAAAAHEVESQLKSQSQ
jgi:hypothetical protein